MKKSRRKTDPTVSTKFFYIISLATKLFTKFTINKDQVNSFKFSFFLLFRSKSIESLRRLQRHGSHGSGGQRSLLRPRPVLRRPDVRRRPDQRWPLVRRSVRALLQRSKGRRTTTSTPRPGLCHQRPVPPTTARGQRGTTGSHASATGFDGPLADGRDDGVRRSPWSPASC